MMVKYMNFFSLILTLFLLVSHLKNDDNRQLSGRKRPQIDLENTEGVFSQQGIFFSIIHIFNWLFHLEPVTIHPYVDQFSQDMTDERPKTAIRRKDSNKNLFDENDDAAELLPPD